ncbi:MAG: hypothetical protein IKT38_03220 [Clostridia bacterium]|nr:hypothetical protein [Clostridia bacterium]
MSVFSVGKRLLNKFPFLTKIAALGYNLLAMNSFKGIKNNSISRDFAFMKNCKIRINGTGNQIIIGQKSFLSNCNFVITGNNNKIVLDDMIYADKCSFCVEDSNNSIEIGEGTHIFGECELAAMEGTQIKLGEGCLVSSKTVFRTGDSHSILDLEGNRINPSKNIILGDRIWVGQRASILKGSVIRDDSVVSFGAIVTKAFDTPNAIIGGVPAKLLKDGISWCSQRVKING